MKEQIFIYGASGHAKVVIDIVERQGVYEIAHLVDDNPTAACGEFSGYRVIGSRKELHENREVSPVRKAIVAIGKNLDRLAVADWLVFHGYRLVSAVHPAAVVSSSVAIGEGSVVMAGAVVNSGTVIGDNVIINSSAVVEHDCHLANGVHIGPGAVLCGGVTVGDGSLIGAGVTVIPNRIIGSRVVIGAGSAVIDDVGDGETVVGVPARAVHS